MSWTVILPGDGISAKVGTALEEIRTAIVERNNALSGSERLPFKNPVAEVPASGSRESLRSVIDNFRSRIEDLASNELLLKVIEFVNPISFVDAQIGGFVKSDGTAFSGIGEARELAGYSADDWESLEQDNEDVIFEMRAVLELLTKYELRIDLFDSIDMVNADTAHSWGQLSKPPVGVSGVFDSTFIQPNWRATSSSGEITKTTDYTADLVYDHTVGTLDSIKIKYLTRRGQGFLAPDEEKIVNVDVQVSDSLGNTFTHLKAGAVEQEFEFVVSDNLEDVDVVDLRVNIDTLAPTNNPFTNGENQWGGVNIWLAENIWSRSLRAQDLTYG